MSLWDPFQADPAKWSQLVSNPNYITSTATYRQAVQQAFRNAGIRPTAAQLAQYGIDDPGDNPYGVAQMLLKGLGTANHHTINAANAAGLEESGAAVGGLNANNEDYKRGAAQNVESLAGGLGGLTQAYAGQIGNIFDSLEQAPVPQAAAAVPNLNPGTSEADRPLVGGQPQVNPWHIPTATGLAQTIVPKRIPGTKVGAFGNLGHIG